VNGWLPSSGEQGVGCGSWAWLAGRRACVKGRRDRRLDLDAHPRESGSRRRIISSSLLFPQEHQLQSPTYTAYPLLAILATLRLRTINDGALILLRSFKRPRYPKTFHEPTPWLLYVSITPKHSSPHRHLTNTAIAATSFPAARLLASIHSQRCLSAIRPCTWRSPSRPQPRSRATGRPCSCALHSGCQRYGSSHVNKYRNGSSSRIQDTCASSTSLRATQRLTTSFTPVTSVSTMRHR
jgi:hypothetical protein